MKNLSINSIRMPLGFSYPVQDGSSDLAAQIQVIVPGYAKLPTSVIDKDVLLIQDKYPLKPTQRLVVLMPPGEIDETALARRVWQLAESSRFSVLYLAWTSDVLQIPYQRRRLATLASMTSGESVHALASVSAEKNWLRVLEQTLQPGDLLVCLANHKVPKHLLGHTPLGEQLVETAGVPVYLLGGLTIEPVPLEQQAIKEIIAWTIFLLVLASFLIVQVDIDRSAARPLSTILISLSVFVEIYLLWKINVWIR